MNLRNTIRLLCLLCLLSALPPLSLLQAQTLTPVSARIILVGDSTMASETGYGDALCQRLQNTVSCLNMAKGGRSSASYRAEGSWSEVIGQLRVANRRQTTYVLIQFGHNDQPGKPGRSTDLHSEFPVNLRNYVREVQALGATPVLVTPLVRREFKGTILQNNLSDWAEATRQIAQAEQVTLLDLNADSFLSVQTMGQQAADTLAMTPPSNQTESASAPKDQHFRGFDHTHLGLKGAKLFSGIVQQELLQQFPALNAAFKQEPVTP